MYARSSVFFYMDCPCEIVHKTHKPPLPPDQTRGSYQLKCLLQAVPSYTRHGTQEVIFQRRFLLELFFQRGRIDSTPSRNGLVARNAPASRTTRHRSRQTDPQPRCLAKGFFNAPNLCLCVGFAGKQSGGEGKAELVPGPGRAALRWVSRRHHDRKIAPDAVSSLARARS